MSKNVSSDLCGTTPEVNAILDTLADLCCDAAAGNSEALDRRSSDLLKALVINGFDRVNAGSFDSELQKRVASSCSEGSKHHAEQRTSIIRRLNDEYQSLTRWTSS